MADPATPAPAAHDAALEDLRKRFPTYAWAFGIPEIRAVLQKAVDEGWGPEELQAQLAKTEWWRKTTPAMRKFEDDWQNDPRDVERRIQIQADEIIEAAKQVGYAIPGATAWDLATQAVRFGWTPNEIERAVRSSFILQPEALQGEALQHRQAIREAAEKQYIILDEDDLNRWTTDIARGDRTLGQFQEWLTLHEDRLSAGKTETERQWEIESVKNPMDTQRKVEQQAASIKAFARQTGFIMSDWRATRLAQDSLRLGWSDQELQSEVKKLFGVPESRTELMRGGQYGRELLIDTLTGRAAFLGPNDEPGYDPNDPNKPQGGLLHRMQDGREVYYIPGTAPERAAAQEQQLTGQALALREKLRELSRAYLIRLTDSDIAKWLGEIVRGDKTEDEFRVWLTGYAKTLFPSLSVSLDNGLTVKEAASPYAGVIQDELGTPADNIDWLDPKWQRFLAAPQQDGTFRAMDLWQVSQMIRTDPTYGWHKTPKATAQAAEMGQFITDTFTGVR